MWAEPLPLWKTAHQQPSRLPVRPAPVRQLLCLRVDERAPPPLPAPHQWAWISGDKSRPSLNELLSLLRLTSGPVFQVQTCQQQPADQRFTQQSGGGLWGGSVHAKHSFILILHSSVHRYLFQIDLNLTEMNVPKRSGTVESERIQNLKMDAN